MLVEQKILESEQYLKNLRVNEVVVSENIGEVVFYQHSGVHGYPTITFVKEKSEREIDFFRSFLDRFSVRDRKVVFPKYLQQKPSFILSEGGAFSDWYEMARETLNKAYHC